MVVLRSSERRGPGRRARDARLGNNMNDESPVLLYLVLSAAADHSGSPASNAVRPNKRRSTSERENGKTTYVVAKERK